MERSQDETEDFCTTPDSDEHPLLSEKTTEDIPKERRDSLLNGFDHRHINKGLFMLLLISVAANIASFAHVVIYKGQVTLSRSSYGLYAGIISL